MNCANSIFDHYFLQYLYANAYWIVNKRELISWWVREALLKIAYYGTWLRTWADRLDEPSYSVWAYCRPTMEIDWRWGVVFGGLGVMWVISYGVWLWMTNEVFLSPR